MSNTPPLYKLVILQFKRIHDFDTDIVAIMSYNKEPWEIKNIFDQNFERNSELTYFIDKIKRISSAVPGRGEMKRYDRERAEECVYSYPIDDYRRYESINKDLLTAHTIGEARKKKKIVEDLMCDIDAAESSSRVIFV